MCTPQLGRLRSIAFAVGYTESYVKVTPLYDVTRLYESENDWATAAAHRNDGKQYE